MVAPISSIGAGLAARMGTPVGGVGAAGAASGPNAIGRAATGAGAADSAGFSDALTRGLQAVSNLEHQADAVTESVATGSGATIEDLMMATTKAQIGVELLAQVRDKAVEAYQEIMRMPV